VASNGGIRVVSALPSWLPQTVTLESYSGDWEQYVEAIYRYFRADFIDGRTCFGQVLVTLVSYTQYKGKEDTFWHVISKEDNTVAGRIPDLRRCERIRWPRPVIEHNKTKGVLTWQRRMNGRMRTVIWVEDADYMVILVHKQGYYALLTAFNVEGSHERENLRAQYESYK
jgi:hypothetical protein